MSNCDWNSADRNRELARERAERSDPFHPIRRSKGEKHRNRKARK